MAVTTHKDKEILFCFLFVLTYVFQNVITASPVPTVEAATTATITSTTQTMTTTTTTVGLTTVSVSFRSRLSTFTNDLMNPSSAAYINRVSMIKTQVGLIPKNIVCLQTY